VSTFEERRGRLELRLVDAAAAQLEAPRCGGCGREPLRTINFVDPYGAAARTQMTDQQQTKLSGR
jgi:hypothetical protein